ncbi:MAG: efflux RND transporter periplasmic adaptor subunit [Patescibacteria group bacterium]|nr:efflux RND transporter periplasmic adaptor subunit [Patescibacteria group bacterium]
MKALFKNKKFLIGLGIVVVVVLLIIFATRGKKAVSDTFTVKKDNLEQQVSITGTVKPAEELALAFEVSGKVSRLGAAVNDHVLAGQTLVELEHADLTAQYNSAQAAMESAEAQLAQYQAALDSQNAKLLALQRGSRPEDIAVKLAELSKAQQDLENYYQDTTDTLSDAFTKSDNGVRTQLSSLFSGSVSTTYNLTYITADYQAGLDAQNQRADIEQKLLSWRQKLSALSDLSPKSELDAALVDGRTTLSAIKTFYERVNDTLQTSTNLTSTTRDTYLGYLYTARNNLVTVLSAVNALEQNIASQKIYVDKIQKEYDLKLSGSDPQDIASQEAVVRQAEASVKSAAAQVKQYQANRDSMGAKIAKTVLISPIVGIVTKQDAKVGEIVAGNVEIAGVISDTNFEIDADVPEVDIAKVKLADTAEVTLDAYGNDTIFPAHVAKIEPAETVISGVIYYKVTLVFESVDERLRSGMTANVTIKTARKEGVLVVPARAVLEEAGAKYVRIVKKNDGVNYEKREVTTGLSGTSGMVEIVSGLSEGDIVITFLK